MGEAKQERMGLNQVGAEGRGEWQRCPGGQVYRLQ